MGAMDGARAASADIRQGERGSTVSFEQRTKEVLITHLLIHDKAHSVSEKMMHK